MSNPVMHIQLYHFHVHLSSLINVFHLKTLGVGVLFLMYSVVGQYYIPRRNGPLKLTLDVQPHDCM